MPCVIRQVYIHSHHTDIAEFATVAFAQQSCMATICISIFYVITVEKEVKNLSLSFAQQSNAQFAPAAKNCISINLLSITNTPTCV